ncbi:hypothetical protein G7046_g2730 [Stylonectria norvegica]|nr:hypothetical protein G7046_g2730 [Stylonectria norvegica]
MASTKEAGDPADSEPQLDKARHIKYWKRCHSSFLPSPYTAYDSTRLTFAYFIISALDLLSVPFTAAERSAIRRWVLSLQHPDGGFCGSSTHAHSGQEARKGTANLAASFFALLLLGIAAEGEAEERAAFAGVDRTKLLRWVKCLQRPDGSFGQNEWDGQAVGGRDTRHSYLASCIRWMLRGDIKEGEEDWVEDVNVEEMVAHIRRGQAYDGGLAESSRHESHAGYAYCAIGALSLLDRPLDSSSLAHSDEALRNGIPDREGLVRFLAYRQFSYLATEEDEDDLDNENYLEAQVGKDQIMGNCDHIGYNGRWNKKADTCYCWWVGGTLKLLGNASIINVPGSRKYILDITQHQIGGFGKNVGAPPDIYHSYLGLAALALMGEPDLKDFDAGLCCSTETTRKVERARGGLLESIKGKCSGWDGDGFWGEAS